MGVAVSRDDAVAYRAQVHHLSERLGGDKLQEAAGACGVQDSPPGSALLALNARVGGMTRERLDAAIGEDKILLRTWCMRGAPFLIPTADAAVFTAGALPPGEEARVHLIRGVAGALGALGMTLSQAVDLTRAEVGEVLAGRRLAIGELGAQLAQRIARALPEEQRATWRKEGPYAPGQPLGEGVVHFCLRILALEQIVCFAPRERHKAPFVLVEEWLGRPAVIVDPAAARAELVRRYLHCYGPATRAGFAAWLGVEAGDIDPWWNLVEDQLTPVEFDGAAWVLAADLPALQSAPAPRGARLLPARDPYTQLRDRETILDAQHHRAVWRIQGEPGTVLVDGRIAGIWRTRASGRNLAVRIQAFGRLSARTARACEVEAEQVGALRGAKSVAVGFED